MTAPGPRDVLGPDLYRQARRGARRHDLKLAASAAACAAAIASVPVALAAAAVAEINDRALSRLLVGAIEHAMGLR